MECFAQTHGPNWLFYLLAPWGRHVPSSEPANRKQMAFPISGAVSRCRREFATQKWDDLDYAVEITKPIRINMDKQVTNYKLQLIFCSIGKPPNFFSPKKLTTNQPIRRFRT
jgi:hypothetical protein